MDNVIKEFQEALTRLGVSYEVRSNNPEPNTWTLSNGQKMKLVNPELVSYLVKVGKGRSAKFERVEFTVVTVRRK